MSKRKVLFLVPYPQKEAPSQRFRLELYEAEMRGADIEFVYEPFISEAVYADYFQEGKTGKKAFGILKGFLRRYLLLLKMRSFDVVWIHRETAPLGFPFYNYLVCKFFAKKTIFELDDAVWMPNVSSANAKFEWLKPYRNSLRLMKWAHTNVCGNEFLLEKALTYNTNSVLIPTVVDTERVHNTLQNQATELPKIGWTGSHSTLPYLMDLIPALSELCKTDPFELVVISDVRPEIEFPPMRFIPWAKETEIQDLLHFHIGLMPLTDQEWAEGKCGLKVIQYQALGIVPAASPVGVNTKLIGNHDRGVLCSSLSEWKNVISFLLRNHTVRKAYAEKCRPFIEEHYSLRSQRHKFLHLLEED